MPPLKAGQGSLDISDPELAAVSNLISNDTVIVSIAPLRPRAARKLKRLVCYALAELHPKNSSIKPILLLLQGMRDYIESPEQDIYNTLRIGRRWINIVSRVSEESDRPLTGILHVIEDSSTLERSSNWQTVLDELPDKSKIMHEAKIYSDFVNHILSQIREHLSFRSGPESHCGILQTVPSIAIAFEMFPKLKATGSTDAAYLLVLLPFFANREISIDILYHGASPRKCWGKLGGIIETHPADVSILRDLIRICSSETLMNILKLDTTLLIPHIRHTLEEAQRYNSLANIPSIVKTDMALSLIESSRFSNMEWKRFAISQVAGLASSLDDRYTQSCLVQRQCVLHRLSGKTDLDVPILPDTGNADVRLHAALGHTLIQAALNHIQRDELSKAVYSLEKWRPSQQPSAMEYVVCFRQNLIFGKIFRYQGQFSESLSCLKISRNIAQVAQDLTFREDTCELTCNIADTYLELKKPAKAEVCLRAEMKYQDSNQALLVVLADALFAQGKFAEADTLCLSLQPPLKLKRVERLRLSIVRAKLSHVRNRFDEAFSYWTVAMDNLRLFNLASGHTTCMILRSQCDILRRQGYFKLENDSKKQLEDLKECAGSDGARYWIAGLRQWLDYLGSGSTQTSPRYSS
ncbi:hypothetical protein ASPSYDRAFT_95826 [Aspergillus sydowii CBS 593.65]|uniref:MalT-like TPR region domain-containing protein n=1 Tax=Aspergillus sydowii CBS 593.65 TaxID=1036612 RepID=A0A1L9SY75_9EURO|nr:uncharacterized protein ASPSYDRAFT_95826 [Aspergillus sydowii CBS 593.65]OJJ52119.1 hypothetical protein ASPSYDRAFT_95826 [Aspergillus sydowii CBS 593.65]